MRNESDAKQVESEFTFRAYLTAILGVASILAALIFGLNVLVRTPMQIRGIDIYVMSLILFSCCYLFLGELRTKAIKIVIGQNGMEKSGFLGFGGKVNFRFSEFDGFLTCDIATKNVVHEYLYLMKGDKKRIKVSEAYHANYRELKDQIALKVKNSGHIQFVFWDEVREIFSK
ncbi:hypothetical protein [Flavobacterium sp.]|uniref:hypothetical protein n=1 Tax=Flavobacterium sp. TaxID=239 RepID=UPI00121DF2F2|nr:hypothetical protein [Flavobacterium sp.]RZJ73211.1 MAG: hypothetical protein EOO49_02575 [Flavobacterium sp.]